MKRVTTALPKASKEELEAAFAASMMEYQAYNTALYDAIDPSILFNGAYETVDRPTLKVPKPIGVGTGMVPGKSMDGRPKRADILSR